MSSIKKLILTSLFAALCCIATIVIQIPSPMEGYLNLGDCFVLLSGWLLGPLGGCFAAGVGSMLADILTGYIAYAPATLIIKAVMALIAAFIYRALSAHKAAAAFCSSIAAELFMTLGYFAYAFLLFGKGAAAALSIPGNLMQGVVAVIAAVLFLQLWLRNKSLQKYFWAGKRKK